MSQHGEAIGLGNLSDKEEEIARCAVQLWRQCVLHSCKSASGVSVDKDSGEIEFGMLLTFERENFEQLGRMAISAEKEGRQGTTHYTEPQ